MWVHAQDQTSTLKHMLRSKFPRLRAFLDVDDLDDISRLEEHVEQSDAILIFLTKGYIKSANCRRELVASLRLGKPLIVVRETDLAHGAASMADLAAEVATVPAEQRAAAAQLRARWPDAIVCASGFKPAEPHRYRHSANRARAPPAATRSGTASTTSRNRPSQ